MNLLNKTTIMLALALVPFLFGTVVRAQQSTFDKDQMNRDLSISEDILGKIFSGNYNQDLPFGRQTVDASYLPGYGIIFHISGSPFAFIRQIRMNTQGNATFRANAGKMQGQTSGVVVGGRGRGLRWLSDADNRLTRQQVIDRAAEFLGNYGNTIGQLQPNDRISIIYEENGNDIIPYGILKSIKDTTSPKPLNLAVSAKKLDITALNQNRITKEAFYKRLSVDDLENSSQHKDLEIFAGILSNALKNNQQYEYSTRGDVSYTYLKEFGAIYFVNAEYSLQYLSALVNAKNYIVQELKSNGSNVSTGTASSQPDEQKLKKAYDRFVESMKDYMTNYGRTLYTLHANQSLVISANLNDGIGDPEKRVTFTIKADILEQLNRGTITVDQAKKTIVVRSF